MRLDDERQKEDKFLLLRVYGCPITVDSQVVIIIYERPNFSTGGARGFENGHPNVRIRKVNIVLTWAI